MSSLIKTEITSPFKKEFNGQLAYIEVPTKEGVVGIYPNHIPLITIITEGLLKITLDNKTSLTFKVKNGFLRLKDNSCHITAKNLIPF